MNAKELHTMLLNSDTAAAQEAALLFLEGIRSESGAKHIFDAATMRWHPTFTANGTKYRVIPPGDGITLLRYTKLRTFLSMVGMDATLSEQMANVEKAKRLIDKIVNDKQGVVDLAVLITNMGEALIRTDRNWHYSTYAATLFIVTEGEDLGAWDEALAERKIADWNSEGIEAADFFLACWLWEAKWNEKLQQFAVRLV
jgi:hypothetical protein